MTLNGQEIEVYDGVVYRPGKFPLYTVIWKLHIHKPEHGTTVAIRDRIIEKAIKAGVHLEVVTQSASEIIDPEQWKKESKLIYRYFKNPKEPMKLYEREVKISNLPEAELGLAV